MIEMFRQGDDRMLSESIWRASVKGRQSSDRCRVDDLTRKLIPEHDGHKFLTAENNFLAAEYNFLAAEYNAPLRRFL